MANQKRFINRDKLKKFILERSRMFEYHVGLAKPVQKFNGIHLANNCRFLDAQSQQLISVVNQKGVELIDKKVLTCLIYALYPQKAFLQLNSDTRGLFSYKEIQELTEHFRGHIEGELIRFPHPFMLSQNRAEDLVCIVEDFLRVKPADNFKGWRASEIRDRFENWYPSYMMNDVILFEFIQNLAYIDELNITLDYFTPVPDWLLDVYGVKYFLSGSKKYSLEAEALNIFDELYYWYLEQEFQCEIEKEFNINDVVHILIQYVKAHNRYPSVINLQRNGGERMYKNILDYRKARTIEKSKETIYN